MRITTPADAGAAPWPLFAAWLVALAATLSAVFIGEVLGQTPCVLCWWQRIAMFPLVAVLGVGLWRDDPGARLYALPLAAAGAALAGWHMLVYLDVIPTAIQPCLASGPSCSGEGMRVLGVPIPLLSLGAFAAILALLALPFSQSRRAFPSPETR
jgi:disulfide bond formation protein DsbB